MNRLHNTFRKAEPLTPNPTNHTMEFEGIVASDIRGLRGQGPKATYARQVDFDGRVVLHRVAGGRIVTNESLLSLFLSVSTMWQVRTMLSKPRPTNPSTTFWGGCYLREAS